MGDVARHHAYYPPLVKAVKIIRQRAVHVVKHSARKAHQVALNSISLWLRTSVNNGAIGPNATVKEIVVWWLLDEAYDPFLGDTRLGPSFVVEYHKPIVGIVINEGDAIGLTPQGLFHNPAVQRRRIGPITYRSYFNAHGMQLTNALLERSQLSSFVFQMFLFA